MHMKCKLEDKSAEERLVPIKQTLARCVTRWFTCAPGTVCLGFDERFSYVLDTVCVRAGHNLHVTDG